MTNYVYTHTYPDHFHKIAQHLGMTAEDVTQEYKVNPHAIYTDKDGRKFNMMIKNTPKPTYDIWGSYPKCPVYGRSTNNGNPSINISESRPPQAVAADIMRRFYPDFCIAHDKGKNYADQILKEWNHLISKLNEYFPGVQTPRQPEGQFFIHPETQTLKREGKSTIHLFQKMQCDLSGSIRIDYQGHIDDPLTITLMLLMLKSADNNTRTTYR